MDQWILLIPLGFFGAVFYGYFRFAHHNSFLESIENYAKREDWDLGEIRAPFREKWWAAVPIYDASYVNQANRPGMARFELKVWKLHSKLDLVSDTHIA
ncbi:MAG: hypothetical protein P1U85_13300 [Verrucomicrobiales bacterium]|jgi:hypothetical protein|nr:hypothetical protein [Verrucomicrobiales bacterium]